MCWSPDNEHIVTGSYDNYIYLIKMMNGDIKVLKKWFLYGDVQGLLWIHSANRVVTITNNGYIAILKI